MNDKFVYTEEVTGEIVNIPISLLHHHHDNPRKDLGDLTELTESIKAKGVLQNLTVVPYWFKLTGVGCDYPEQQAEMGYLVVIGNRRLEAAKKAGLETLPCIIANMTHAEQVQTMLLENMQRADLTVYEQAQGFQMMMDFGDSVDVIAEKTGFSTTTIRRRLKMAELDAETLKSVSDRQISISDFDLLSKVDDISKRNEILKKIGTNNFNSAVEIAIRDQEIAKKLPLMKEQIKKLKGHKLTWSDTYNGKYSSITNRINIAEWDGSQIEVSEVDKLFYYLEENGRYVEFYKEREKATPVRRSAEELEKEKAARDAAEKLNEASAMYYKLRKEFAENIKVTAKNQALIMKWMTKAMIYDIAKWMSHGNTNRLAESLGVSEELEKCGYDKRFEVLSGAAEKDDQLTPKVLYNYFGDEESIRFYTAYESDLKRGILPQHKREERLDMLYDYLCDFGYEMSDEEKALQNGTHELFEKE